MSNVGRIQVGHPVDVGSGTVFTMMDDFVFAGTLNLAWSRYYSTDLEAIRWLGRGWTVPWFMAMERVADGYLLTDEQGRSLLFSVPGGGDLPIGGRVLNFGANMELVRHPHHLVVEHWHHGSDDIERFCFAVVAAAGVMPLSWIENVSGHRILLTYDTQGRPVRLTQEIENRQIELTYGARNLIQAAWQVLQDGSRKRLVQYEYDDHDRLVAAVDALEHRTEYRYDASHRMVRETNALGSSFHFRYDAKGRCVHTLGDGGYLERRLRYTEAPPATYVTDGAGETTQYILNPAGQVIQQISPLGSVTTTEFDAFGRPVASHDALGNITRFEYDDRGNRSAVVYPDGSRCETWHNEFHLLSRYADPTGAQWAYTYNAKGEVIGLTTPTQTRHAAVRDARGLVTDSITPTGRRLSRRYEPTLRWAEAADAISLITRTEFDESGNQIAISDALGLVQRVEYDAMNRPIRTEDGAGRVFQLSWNALGMLSSLSGPGIPWERRIYDNFGQLVEHVNPLGSMFIEYDVEGRIRRVTNRDGQQMTWSFDADGRLATESGFDGRVERFEYDLADRPVLIHKPDGRTIAQTYNAFGAIVRRSFSDGRIDEFAYDPAGRLLRAANADASLTLERDAEGQVTAEIQNGRRIEYVHDADGDRSERRIAGLPDGVLQFKRDARKRLTALADAQGVCVEMRWDNADRFTERQFQNKVAERVSYDRRGLLAHQAVQSPEIRVPIERRYQYDAHDNLVAKQDWRQGAASYQFDELGRLVGVREPGGDQAYAYSPVGAILQSHRGVRTLGPGGATLQEGPRQYTYAADGSVSRIAAPAGPLELEHNVDGQVTKAVLADGRSVTYMYDPLGRRVAKDVAGKRVDFLWEGPVLAAEYENGVATTRYCFHGLQPLLQWSGTQKLLPIRDCNGLVRELIDSHGRLAWEGRFDAYGSLIAQSGSAASRIRFRGQYFDDETGLHYNFCRYYDPLTADYTARDPIGIEGGAHPYAYPRNPLLWDDPFGLKCSNAHSAETSMDGYFGAKGYKKIGARGKSVNANGIDAIYYKRGGRPPYIIAEAKSGSARLGSDMHGNQQMSDAWINGRPGDRGATRLNGAFPDNSPYPQRIDAAASKGNVQKVVYNPGKDPKVVQTGTYNGTSSTTTTF